MTGHTELLNFMVGAIEDWKEERITAGRLFEIFRVNYFEAYPKLLDEENRTGKWLDLPTERIAEILLSCELFIPGPPTLPKKEYP